jgi:hypothetical protein
LGLVCKRRRECAKIFLQSIIFSHKDKKPELYLLYMNFKSTMIEGMLSLVGLTLVAFKIMEKSQEIFFENFTTSTYVGWIIDKYYNSMLKIEYY